MQDQRAEKIQEIINQIKEIQKDYDVFNYKDRPNNINCGVAIRALTEIIKK